MSDEYPVDNCRTHLLPSTEADDYRKVLIALLTARPLLVHGAGWIELIQKTLTKHGHDHG